MGLAERRRGFGRRPTAGAAPSAVLRPADAYVAESAVRVGGAAWSAEDYLDSSVTPADLEDHWAVVAGAPTGASMPTGADPRDAATPDVGNFPAADGPPARPVGVEEAFNDFKLSDMIVDVVVAGWSEHGEPELPFFDPSATAAPVVANVFAGPHQWRVGTRAGLLALATAIPHRHGRDLAARAFEEGLAQARWPGFFRSWLRLAPSLDCPRVIALAIELKEHWDDSPHLWRFRDGPSRPSRQHESARGHLGWL